MLGMLLDVMKMLTMLRLLMLANAAAFSDNAESYV